MHPIGIVAGRFAGATAGDRPIGWRGSTEGATVQIMPDPLEANFAEAMGLEHFADALQAGEPFS